jgi:hypothetical protein
MTQVRLVPGEPWASMSNKKLAAKHVAMRAALDVSDGMALAGKSLLIRPGMPHEHCHPNPAKHPVTGEDLTDPVCNSSRSWHCYGDEPLSPMAAVFRFDGQIHRDVVFDNSPLLQALRNFQ